MTEQREDQADRPGAPLAFPLTAVELRMILESRASPIWPLERLLGLCRLYDAGESTRAIGDQIGCGKNAAIGKIHRLVECGALILRGQPGGIPSTAPPKKEINRLNGAAGLAHARAVTQPARRPVAPIVAATPPAAPPTPVAPPVVSARLIPTALNRPLAPVPARPIAVAPPPVPETPPPPLAVRYGRIIECCWPMGDPGTKGFRFCEDPSAPGRPYCVPHAKGVYLKERGHAAAFAGDGSLLAGAS